jgi:autotransporter-associated beta strand protein
MKTSSYLFKQIFFFVSLLAVANAVIAADIYKADNANDLNLTTSWTNGVVPGASDVGVWDLTVSGPNTVLLAATSTWSGLRISAPAGPVTINATSTNANAGAVLTLGASGLDMSAASQDLTFGSPVGLLGSTAQQWTVGAGRTLTLNGTLIRNTRATLNVDNSAGGNLVVGSGTASTVLNYSTLNKTDFGALDASKNFVGAASVITYTANPAGTANNANLTGGSGTTWVDVVTSNPVGGPSAFRLSGNFTCAGIRFNTPNANGIDWVVDANSRNLNVSSTTILVTPNAGSRNVQINTSTGNVRLGTGSEVIFAQHNLNGDLVINGQITQAGAGSFVTKTGAGRVILTSAFNNYSGGTFVEQGTLLVNSPGVITNGAATVNSGATFGGSGAAASVTIANGATLAPGNSGVGALTVNGPLTLNAGTVSLNFYGPNVPTTNLNALLVVSNTFTVSATVNVSILSGNVAVGQYPLLRWTNSIPGATFSAFNLVSIAPHVTAFLSNNVANSTIDLVVTSVNQPLRWAAGNGTWDIGTSSNWKDALGAATTYQELVGVGDRVIFEDTQSGASPITVTLNTSVSPGSVTVSNLTKNFTISGSGGVGGSGALTKQGSATLTLATVNSFSGGLNLNGGILNFSSLANLGGSAINFGGGTLQFAFGNVDDISVHTVTFTSGGATIDDGGNFLNFINPVGNNGAGGLTKIGAGTLVLNGTNRYTGNTLISQGTLALGANSYISNSAAIIVNSLLDVTSSGLPLTLRGANNQILAGTGTVNGGVTLPTGAVLSPATNGVVGTLNINNGDLILSGGTLAFDVSNASHDLLTISNAGNLTITSGTLQLNVSGLLNNGTYRLIAYGGVLISGAGSSGNLTVTGFSQTGKAAILSDATPGEIDLVIADTASDHIIWSGFTSSDWDLVGTLNWSNGPALWAYTNGDFVTFDDTLAANSFVTLQTAVLPGALVVNNSLNNYVFADGTGTGGGKISGSTGLIKDGSGTLELDTLNDYSGPTVIKAGTLQVGNNSAAANIGTGNVTNDGALVFMQPTSRTVAGQVSGTGPLTQQGLATLTLAQNNTYTGLTTISSGTLQIGNGVSAGTLGTADVVDNAALSFNRTGTLTVTNVISGTGSLSVNGGGTITLTASNFYTGGTTINAGKLVIGSATAISGVGNFTVQAAGTNDMNGHDLTVSRLNSTLGAGGRIVNNSGTATNVVIIDYNGTGNADESIALLDNEGAGGRLAVLKLGTGSQIMRGGSTYTGGTVVSNGTLNVRANAGLGAGQVTLRGGNLSFAGITFANPIQADTNATLDTPGNANVTLTGNVTTASNLTVFIDNNETWSWNGAANQLAGVTGTIIITGGPGFFRFQASQGSAATTFDMTGSTATINSQGVGTFQLGALVGDSTPFLGAVAGSTFVIGGKNLNTTFGGTLNAVNNNLVKAGSGTFTLSGTDNFTGATTVSNGVLALVEPTSLDSSPNIAVRSGAVLDVTGRADGSLNLGNLVAQTLSGNGTVNGKIVVAANSTVSPGDTIGTLTIANNAQIDGVALMQLNRTNAPATNDMLVAQSFTGAGTITVTNVGPTLLTGDSFKLFNMPVSGYTTVLPATDVSGLISYSWDNRLAIDGTIKLLSGLNAEPTTITFEVSGNRLNLSWPADHTGWHLQAQTNSVAVGLTPNWVTVPGSIATNQMSFAIGPTNGAVFFRLAYP